MAAGDPAKLVFRHSGPGIFDQAAMEEDTDVSDEEAEAPLPGSAGCGPQGGRPGLQ